MCLCVCVWDDEPVHELSSLIDCESILKARIIAGFHLRSYMYMMCVCVCVCTCVCVTLMCIFKISCASCTCTL